MALCSLRRHRLPLPLPLLLAILFAASSRGDPSGDDYKYNTSICKPQLQPYTCGGVDIHYPFYLSDQTADVLGNAASYCGYPGLAINCVDDKYPTLQLGSGGGPEYPYNVKGIDYTGSTIYLADPDVLDGESSCPVDHNVSVPPNLWLNFNTSGYLLFFANCSTATVPGQPFINPITCPSSMAGDYSFVVPSDVPYQTLSQACDQVIQVPVLQNVSLTVDQQWSTDGYRNVLKQGFQLGWNTSLRSEQCTKCEESKGGCAYSKYGEFVACLCPNGRVNSEECPKAKGSKKKKTIITAVVAGGAAVAVAMLAAAIFVFVMRKRKQKKVINSSSKLLKYSGSGGTPRSRVGDMESGTGSIEEPPTHLFSYEELEEATDSFSENREVGDGGFGAVYKGYLKDGRVVAVKRLYNNSYRRVEQFQNEAAILSGLRHPNLVMFYGCTSSHSRELLLVYEFVANGTVADHLHGSRASERALSWPLRLSIAVESAAALTYLHAIEPPVVHRDVKTTNILLDADYHVKVADFGLSRLFPLDVTHVSTAPQGTPGYVDPEYHQCYQLTDKSDVYSFGVVLVELISSKPAVDITRHRNEINLAGMAISKIQKCQLEELVDVGLGYETDPATKKMMTMVAELAFRCLQQDGGMRPPIKEVLEVLRSIQGECLAVKDGDKKNKDGPVSPTTVHAPWDSRATTPNTSRD